ncbi:MAG TPA: hypothetical protein GX391_04415 [Firmicutes bacterium]|jgi:hypothetical protein|nr:hypothetical protein [Bacillota bacterium]HOQ23277.1 carbohydrate-binding protein [Bacillota bacterium]HPT66703.1 carbohydrate-binding protein [Bacillota bacterium]
MRIVSRLLLFPLVAVFLVMATQMAVRAVDRPVNLFYGKINLIKENGVIRGYNASGFISVQSLGGAEKVYVRYCYPDGNWKEVEAKYERQAADGTSAWSFKTEDIFPSFHYYDFSCRFAIRYEVGGKTYWDNNGGKDYFIRSTNVPVKENIPYVLGKSALFLEYSCRCNNGRQLEGGIILKNLGYNKTVKIIYTTDNWGTVKEAYASYAESFATGLERWTFHLTDLPTNGKVKFCIAYTVNGTTYWDNNFRNDYQN